MKQQFKKKTDYNLEQSSVDILFHKQEKQFSKWENYWIS